MSTYTVRMSTCLLTIGLILAFPGIAPTATINWDFYHDGAGDLNNWAVLSGAAFFRSGDGDGMTPADSGGGRAHDAAHTTFLVESPEFVFDSTTLDGTNAMSWTSSGGAGDQSSGGTSMFADAAAVLAYNNGNSYISGQKGLAFLNTATNTYDAVLFNLDDGGNDTYNLSATDLTTAGVDLSQGYRLHYYENDYGGWGWGQLNSVDLASNLIPTQVAGDANLDSGTLFQTQENLTYGPAPVGRYVRLSKSGDSNSRLHISELEAFGETVNPNHAGPVNGGIYLSTNDITPAGYDAATTTTDLGHGAATGVYDNDAESGGAVWSTNPDLTAPDPRYTLDLGSEQAIGLVLAFARNDGCCEDRFRNLQLDILADDGTVVATSSDSTQSNMPREFLLTPITSGEEVVTLTNPLGYVFEIDGDTLEADNISVETSDPGIYTTVLDINDVPLIVELESGILNPGDTFQLFNADFIIGSPSSLVLPGGLPPAVYWDTSDLFIGGSIQLAVPEPSTLTLASFGLLGLLGLGWRRRNR